MLVESFELVPDVTAMVGMVGAQCATVRATYKWVTYKCKRILEESGVSINLYKFHFNLSSNKIAI